MAELFYTADNGALAVQSTGGGTNVQFFKGLRADLPEVGDDGVYYQCTDTGELFLGTGTGMKQVGSSDATIDPKIAYAEYTGTSTDVVVTTISGYFPETLTEGAAVAVKIEGSLTLIKTLNVNSTGAKNVYYKGNSLTSGTINRYNTYLFIYDGSYYRIIGVDTDTHYTAKNVVTSSATSKTNAAGTNGNVYLNEVENSTVRSSHKIVGTGATSVTSDASGNITIDTPLKTINGESIIGSGDITISGGSSSGSSAYAEVSHGTSDTTFTLTPNVFHIWDEVTELNITLGSETSGVANEYLFQFTSGSEPTVLSLPDDIKWANDEAPVIEANKIYQISILKGLGSVLVFDNVNIIDNHITVSETDTIGYVLQYPNASELTISYYGPYASTQILTLPIGSTSFQCPGGKEGTTRGSIISIVPSNDNKYNYILS